MRGALTWLIVLGVSAHIQAGGAGTLNSHARVRAMDKRVETLLATGMDRSPTFRQLVRRIEGSDVIVYIEARHDLRIGGASMRFLAKSASDRFVRIQLNAGHNNPTLVAILGHELQHAVEVAEHPDVESAEDLRSFYRQSGVRTGPDSFDSEAARHAGYVVRDEIAGRTGELRLAHGARVDEQHLLDSSIVSEDIAGPATR